MANLSFSLSFRLPLSIKTTHVQPHGLVFFQTFSSVTEFVHPSHHIILDMHFLHSMQLSYPALLPSPGLALCLPQNSFILHCIPGEHTDFAYACQALSSVGKKKGGSRTRLNPTCGKNWVITYTRGSPEMGLCCDSKSRN